eukprot:1956088-Pyramimonas_sp.AAC.1
MQLSHSHQANCAEPASEPASGLGRPDARSLDRHNDPPHLRARRVSPGICQINPAATCDRSIAPGVTGWSRQVASAVKTRSGILKHLTCRVIITEEFDSPPLEPFYYH